MRGEEPISSEATRVPTSWSQTTRFHKGAPVDSYCFSDPVTSPPLWLPQEIKPAIFQQVALQIADIFYPWVKRSSHHVILPLQMELTDLTSTKIHSGWMNDIYSFSEKVKKVSGSPSHYPATWTNATEVKETKRGSGPFRLSLNLPKEKPLWCFEDVSHKTLGTWSGVGGCLGRIRRYGLVGEGVSLGGLKVLTTYAISSGFFLPPAWAWDVNSLLCLPIPMSLLCHCGL